MLRETPNYVFSVEIPTTPAPPLDNLDRLCYLGVTTMPRRNICAFYGDAHSHPHCSPCVVFYLYRKTKTPNERATMKRDDLTPDERLLYMPMWERVALGAFCALLPIVGSIVTISF